MLITNIEDALHQTPFVPFDLHLDNGRTVHVKHPDYLLFNESKRTTVVVEGERFHIIDVDHVTSVSFVSR